MDATADIKSTVFISRKRTFLLGAVFLFHTGLVFRFRIVRLFPSDWIGYGVIGLIYFCIAIGLLFLARSNSWSDEIALPRFASSSIFRTCLIVSGALIAILGLAWRYQAYAGTRIHPQLGDMLPLIDMVTDTFLTGQFPYKVYEFPWKVPLTYMPGLWMTYLPAQFLDFDLRHTGLLCSAGVVLLMLAAMVRRDTDTEVLIAGWVVIFCFCLSPAIARFSINGHTYPLWLYIGGFCMCLIGGHYKAAALCFGLVLATRQTSLVYLPFILVFFWRQGGWQLLWTSLVLMGLVCAALCLPFAIIDYRAFLFDPLTAYAQMADWDFQRGEESYVARTIGFAYAFKNAELFFDMSWLRYGLLALLPFVAWYCVSSTFSSMVGMGAAGIFFALLAPVSWYYIYVPPILILSFAALVEPISERNSDLEGTKPAEPT